LFRFAHDAKWITDNPAKQFKTTKVTANPTLPFPPEEFAAILTACDSYTGFKNKELLKAFILALRHSGQRIRDVVTLKRSAITNGRLFLRSAKTGVPVHLPLPPECLDALDALPADGPYYFWSGQGLPKTRVGNFQGMLKSIFKSANVAGGHAQRFRDTFAVELLLAGATMNEGAALLGNSTKVFERHYAPWVQARQEQLDAIVRDSWIRTKSRTTENGRQNNQ
jgi:integrase/recombinase XerD